MVSYQWGNKKTLRAKKILNTPPSKRRRRKTRDEKVLGSIYYGEKNNQKNTGAIYTFIILLSAIYICSFSYEGDERDNIMAIPFAGRSPAKSHQ